ncbi:hypothetical protein Moror_10719 [Moniliophthora roreri MCA 2997]|uniref:Integral membrane protein n=1 Tax=Moniliophthora roreri (strain MCA 2997) TaxID=1381753 RepID=V2WXV9_MONRO|nr:hypothetical protein Moror_10719 [Moniliophthora roreri MCA 2997]
MAGTLDDLTASTSVIMPISSLSVMYFVYGLYTTLFISYIRTLRWHSKRTEPKSSYLLPTIILFILTTLVNIGQTIYQSLYLYTTFNAIKTKNFEPLNRNHPRKTLCFASTAICAVLLNVTVDYILIHRCWVIWGSRKRIVLPLAATSIGTNVVGMVGSIVIFTEYRSAVINRENPANLGHVLYGGHLAMSVIVNISITTLTAGRIWWMCRQSHGNERFYKSVLGIVIESGLIYPISTLVHVIIRQAISYRDIPFEFSCISYQTAGIAPTLIAVRVQLGKTVENTMHDQAVVSEINFSSYPPLSDFSSSDDIRNQVPVNGLDMQQAHESGLGSLNWKEDGI